MKKLNKLVALAVLSIIATVTVFGNGKEEAKAPASAFDASKQYTVTMGLFGDLEKAYQVVFDSADFKAKYPNITVQFQSSDFGGHHDRLTTQIAAGERTNDIESLEVGFIAHFVEQGNVLVDLNAAPFNASASTKDLVDYALAQGVNRKGAQVALPVDIAPAVLFYREDLAKEAGANFENLKSWDEYIAESKKVTGNGRFAVPHANDVALVPLFGGKGGWLDAKGEFLQPKKKFMDALTLVANVKAAGIDADLGAWSGPWISAFADGTVVSIPNGAWWGGALRTWVAPEVTDWRVTYLPGKSMSSMGGTFLSIPATVPAENRAAAWEVIKYLTTSKEAQLLTFRTIDAFPALTSTYNDPIMDEPVPYFGNQKVRKIFADVALNMPSLPVTEYDNIVNSIWGSVVGLVIEGELEPEAAYDLALTQIKATVE